MGKKRNKSSKHCDMKIAMIGVGGGGMNTLDALLRLGIPAAKYIAVNRDSTSLRNSCMHDKIELDAPKNDPETIVKATGQHEVAIRKLLKGMDMVVIVAGMGGMTGSYASPEIAHFARKMDVKVWAVVTEPFHFEGSLRAQCAKEGIEKLIQNADAVVCLPNHSLIKNSPKGTSMADAFRMVSEAIADILGLISEGMDDPKSILGQLPYACTMHYGPKERDSSRVRPKKNKKTVCSFCGKKQSETKKMISGSKGFICKECVKICAEIISEKNGN